MFKIKSQNFFLAGGLGVASAMFYSLTPLFVFFFNDSPIGIIYAIFLATIQELMSFLLVGINVGFEKWQAREHSSKTKWLNYTLIVPFGYMVGVGIATAITTVIQKLKKGKVWIMSLVGLLAGPISMALLMISAIFLNDGTLGNLILNTAPIYCMILSRLILKEKINKTALGGIIITSLLTFGMLFNFFFIQPEINWKAVVGVLLSFIAALSYAFEGLVSDYFFHNDKIQLTNYEVVMIKSFSSFWIMLIFALPIISVINSGFSNFYLGWTVFKTSFDDYGWIAILAYASGVVMGTGRLMYFKSISLSSGTYTLTTQLTMLIWTPVLQIIGNALISEISTADVAWYYWVWSSLILIGLVIVTFNEKINQWFLHKKEQKLSTKHQKELIS